MRCTRSEWPLSSSKPEARFVESISPRGNWHPLPKPAPHSLTQLAVWGRTGNNQSVPNVGAASESPWHPECSVPVSERTDPTRSKHSVLWDTWRFCSSMRVLLTSRQPRKRAKVASLKCLCRPVAICKPYCHHHRASFHQYSITQMSSTNSILLFR